MEQENKMQAFAYGDQMVRTIEREDGTWWVLKDVCNALGLTNSRIVSDRLDKDEKGVSQIYTLGGAQQSTIVNEPGLYSVILRSDKPEAKTFKRWITHEVLPQIRKTGSYGPADQQVNAQLVATLSAMTALLKEIVPIVKGAKNSPYPTTAAYVGPLEEREKLMNTISCKVESFPQEMRDEIDHLMEEMLENQTVNLSRIVRFCAAQGYPISHPAIKRYYVSRFVKK